MNKVHFEYTDVFIDIANKIFEEQKKRILESLPFAKVYHIGSTAVPNSITKGDLDINVRVKMKHFEEACKKLEELYSIDVNNKRTNTTASFKDDLQELPIGIQLTVIGSKYDDFVKLRDLLLNNYVLLKELNELKRKFEGKDMGEYRTEKAKFFQKLREKLVPAPIKSVPGRE